MARPTLAKSAPTLAKCGIGLFSNDIQTKSYKTTARSPLEQRFRNWWEVQDPKPTTPYIGGKKILEKLVAAGWTENEVISALDAAPTISTGCLEIALKRGRNGNGYQPTDPSPNTVNGAPIGASHATLDRPPASRRVI